MRVNFQVPLGVCCEDFVTHPWPHPSLKLRNGTLRYSEAYGVGYLFLEGSQNTPRPDLPVYPPLAGRQVNTIKVRGTNGALRTDELG